MVLAMILGDPTVDIFSILKNDQLNPPCDSWP